jgi:hypothetical protein
MHSGDVPKESTMYLFDRDEQTGKTTYLQLDPYDMKNIDPMVKQDLSSPP